MSFGFLSPLTVALGLVGLTGVLFLLARLRVRHREVVVPTTLFWRQALDETRARELVERFRHPWAFAFTLLLAGLLWLALAGLRSEPTRDVERIVVVDGAALDEARWARLAEGLPAIIDRFEPGTLRVVLADTVPAALFEGQAGSPLALERLTALDRGIAPRALEDTLLALGRGRADARPLELWLVAPTPVRPEVLALLDEDVSVRAVPLEGIAVEGNRGITVLGVGEADSGRFDAVDVRIEETGPVGADPLIAVDGAPLVVKRVDRATSPNRRVGVLRDVPANGRTLRVTFPSGDAFPSDDEAVVTLPRRTPIRVALDLDDDNLRAVLERDPGVDLVGADPEVRIGSSAADDAPTLAFVPADAEPNAFQVVFEADQDAERVLLETWRRLGLDQIDGTRLAEELSAPVGFGARAGERRGVRVLADLLSSEFDFAGSRAFPLFIAGAVRWLAGVEPLRAEVRAGAALADDADTWRDDGGVVYATVATGFRPPRAGRFEAADGESLWASLLDAELSVAGRGAAGSFGEPETPPDERNWFSLLGWIELLVLLGLGLEWHLHQRGKLP